MGKMNEEIGELYAESKALRRLKKIELRQSLLKLIVEVKVKLAESKFLEGYYTEVDRSLEQKAYKWVLGELEKIKRDNDKR